MLTLITTVIAMNDKAIYYLVLIYMIQTRIQVNVYGKMWNFDRAKSSINIRNVFINAWIGVD